MDSLYPSDSQQALDPAAVTQALAGQRAARQTGKIRRLFEGGYRTTSVDHFVAAGILISSAVVQNLSGPRHFLVRLTG